MNKKNITGIILAGGKSSRMGEEKGMVNFRGKPMIEYSIDMFRQLGYKILIVANDEVYMKYGIPVVADDYHDKGPMAGIYTGLKNSDTSWNAVITCDVPLIVPQIFSLLELDRDGVEAILPKFENKLQPLTAMYHLSSIGVFHESILNNELKVKAIRNKLAAKIVDFDASFAESFTNMNTKEDITRCE